VKTSNPTSLLKIKAEPEVSCMPTVREISQICRSANLVFNSISFSACAHESSPLCSLGFEELFLKCVYMLSY
jgi:hypothetical protein